MTKRQEKEIDSDKQMNYQCVTETMSLVDWCVSNHLIKSSYVFIVIYNKVMKPESLCELVRAS